MAKAPPSVVTGFGVEIEVVLAFHEDLMVNVLKQRHLTKDHIVKQIPSATKNKIGFRNHRNNTLYLETRPRHRGWVLRVDEADSPKDWLTRNEDDSRANVVGGYRTYWSEPLHIVQGILRRLKNYTIDVEVSKESYLDKNSYKEWKVVNDFTLAPASKAQMKVALEDRITEKEVDNWDNTGLELVTPIMYRLGSDIDFDEIELYLETLHGNETSDFGVFSSKYGSVHVHIGFADSADTLLVLQHLAFIVLQYEPLLLKLFPFHRNGSDIKNMRGGLCREDTKSNQDSARMYETMSGAGSSVTMDDLGSRVFSIKTIVDLCVMMQFNCNVQRPDYHTKGYLVNFINMAEVEKGYEGAKRTVEFRHHESTADPDAIKMWVKLLLRICHAAQRIARTDLQVKDQKESLENIPLAEKERRKYKSRPSQVNYVHTMEEFFELVRLKDEESLEARDRELRNYWQSRYDLHHNETEGLQPSPDFPDSSSSAAVGEQTTRSDAVINAEERVMGGNSDAATRNPESRSPSTEQEEDGDIIMRGTESSKVRRRRREPGSRPLRRLNRGPFGQRIETPARRTGLKGRAEKAALLPRVLRSGRKY